MSSDNWELETRLLEVPYREILGCFGFLRIFEKLSIVYNAYLIIWRRIAFFNFYFSPKSNYGQLHYPHYNHEIPFDKIDNE